MKIERRELKQEYDELHRRMFDSATDIASEEWRKLRDRSSEIYIRIGQLDHEIREARWGRTSDIVGLITSGLKD